MRDLSFPWCRLLLPFTLALLGAAAFHLLGLLFVACSVSASLPSLLLLWATLESLKSAAGSCSFFCLLWLLCWPILFCALVFCGGCCLSFDVVDLSCYCLLFGPIPLHPRRHLLV
ncbi:uncharacterized protein J3R85_016972 [Psidium guajava]|nr:uncharacterized protein J3R85_016972 [Psidium guajava]